MRLIDADAIHYHQMWEENWTKQTIYFGNGVPEWEIDEMPTVDYIYGYSIKDLIIFADVCKKQNISNENLKDFCENAALIYEYIQKDFFDNLQKNINCYWGERKTDETD